MPRPERGTWSCILVVDSKSEDVGGSLYTRQLCLNPQGEQNCTDERLSVDFCDRTDPRRIEKPAPRLDA